MSSSQLSRPASVSGDMTSSQATQGGSTLASHVVRLREGPAGASGGEYEFAKRKVEGMKVS